MDCITEDLRKATGELLFIAEHGQAWMDELEAEIAVRTKGMPSDKQALFNAPFAAKDQVYGLARLLRRMVQCSEPESLELAIDHLLPTRRKARIQAIITIANEIRSKEQKPQTRAAAVANKVNQQLRTKRSGGIITIATDTPEPLIARRGASCR